MANKPPYALSSEAVLKQEQTSLTGLTKEAAQTRLNENGPNELGRQKRRHVGPFLDQFKDFGIMCLVGCRFDCRLFTQ